MGPLRICERCFGHKKWIYSSVGASLILHLQRVALITGNAFVLTGDSHWHKENVVSVFLEFLNVCVSVCVFLIRQLFIK